jgi:hypothetical protein
MVVLEVIAKGDALSPSFFVLLFLVFSHQALMMVLMLLRCVLVP